MKLAGAKCLLLPSALLARTAPGRWEDAAGELRVAAGHLKETVTRSRRSVRDWKRKQEKTK